jgi:hypothetical protein
MITGHYRIEADHQGTNKMITGHYRIEADRHLIRLEQYQSNVFIKPFLHQLMSQSAVQKPPSLKNLQTESNADVESR